MDFSTCYSFTAPSLFPKQDENTWLKRANANTEEELIARQETYYMSKLEELSAEDDDQPIPGLGADQRPLPQPEAQIQEEPVIQDSSGEDLWMESSDSGSDSIEQELERPLWT